MQCCTSFAHRMENLWSVRSIVSKSSQGTANRQRRSEVRAMTRGAFSSRERLMLVSFD